MEKTHYAVCVLNQDGNSGVSGIVKTSQVEGQKTRITAEIKGLTPGLHGFHIHQFGKYLSRIFGLTFAILQETSLKDARPQAHTTTHTERFTVVQPAKSDTLVTSET